MVSFAALLAESKGNSLAGAYYCCMTEPSFESWHLMRELDIVQFLCFIMFDFNFPPLGLAVYLSSGVWHWGELVVTNLGLNSSLFKMFGPWLWWEVCADSFLPPCLCMGCYCILNNFPDLFGWLIRSCLFVKCRSIHLYMALTLYCLLHSG